MRISSIETPSKIFGKTKKFKTFKSDAKNFETS